MPIPSDLLLGHNFDSADFFLNYSAGGDKKPAIIGTPGLIAGHFGNAVDLAVTANDEFNWNSTGLLTGLVQTGCISFWIRTAYSGTPVGDNQVFYFSGFDSGNTNRIAIMHFTTTGLLEGLVYSSGGVVIATTSAAWNPTAGTWYNLELNFNVAAGGDTRMFVDGVQLGATVSASGTRTNTSKAVNIGALPLTTPTNQFAMDELLVYGAVQHTADFTPAIEPMVLIHDSDLIEPVVLEAAGPVHDADLVWWFTGPPPPPLATCALSVDYKMDSIGPDAELTVQRTSDLQYWDETTRAWQTTFSSVTLPNSTVRIALPVINAVGIYDADDPLIITIQRGTAVPPAYKVFLYKVYLNKNP